MNKLLFSEGGQPLYLNDLDFMQSAFSEALRGILSTYGNVILSGCEILPPDATTGNLTVHSWEKGYMAIEGEVYQVDKGSLSGVENATLYWKVVSIEGQKEIFENSSEHYVYQYRKVILTDTVVSGDVYIEKGSMKKIEDILTGKVSNSFEIPMSSKTFDVASNPMTRLTVSKNKSTLYCSIYLHSFGTASLTNGLVGRYPVDQLNEEERNMLNQSGVLVLASSAFGEFQTYILDARYEGQIYLRNMDGSPVTSLSKTGSGTVTFIKNM